MSTFGDFEPDDVFDVDDLEPEAVGRVFLVILRRLADEGQRGEVLVLLAFARLLERLRREGSI